jgi:hypothetical protein
VCAVIVVWCSKSWLGCVCVQRLREEWYDRVLARKAALRRQLEELQLPGNPLDMIIQAMGGPSKVAESEW